MQKQLGTLQGLHRTFAEWWSAQLHFWLYCKTPHRTSDKKPCEEYKKEANIQNKMKHENVMHTQQGENGKSERDKKRSKFTN